MRRAELSRRLIAAIFVPLFAANLVLLAAVGTACHSCKPKAASVSSR